MTAIHQHDSDCCTYLGTDRNRNVDYYHCEQRGNPTLIARYSSQDSDYVSGLYLYGMHDDITRAGDLAVALGVLSPNKLPTYRGAA